MSYSAAIFTFIEIDQRLNTAVRDELQQIHDELSTEERDLLDEPMREVAGNLTTMIRRSMRTGEITDMLRELAVVVDDLLDDVEPEDDNTPPPVPPSRPPRRPPVAPVLEDDIVNVDSGSEGGDSESYPETYEAAELDDNVTPISSIEWAEHYEAPDVGETGEHPAVAAAGEGRDLTRFQEIVEARIDRDVGA